MVVNLKVCCILCVVAVKVLVIANYCLLISRVVIRVEKAVMGVEYGGCLHNDRRGA